MGEEKILGVTKAVNWLLAKPALALFAMLHIHPANPEYPIPNFFAMELLVFLFGVLFFLWLKGRISADRPGATQQSLELVITNSMGVGVKDLIDDIVGHGAEKHIPMLGTIGIFILLCNLVALIPGTMSPTAEKTVPLACATVVFLYYNWFRAWKTRADRLREDADGTGAGNFADHVRRGNREPFCAAAFAHRPSLGQHDGQRVDFRFVPGPFDRAFQFPER